ncbi:uncharacterized protein N7459_008696 [Penicillium hispanicum]|uniref:uncharacterized protein n=1 Tax=Penicillium hispanicum TaxID=1080232 RepID=UPI00254001FF|nr:uncharacterized protein N7459_008696 [Penicillium hispanicum]KAJ5574269.1 hypothetical protein N7459_008696 [Penicillium hispanicum]
MGSSNMGHQAARAQEEGTTEMETRPSFASHQTSQTSHPYQSNCSRPIPQSTMSSTNTNLSNINTYAHLEPQDSKSSSSLTATTAIWSPKISAPVSPASSAARHDPEAIELGVDPATLRTASFIDCPSSLDELRARIKEIEEKLVSKQPPPSQYLWVTQIPTPLFTTLKEAPEALQRVRATLTIPHKKQILFKVMPGYHHEEIIQTFTAFLHQTLGDMCLSRLNRDFWLRGAGEATGHSTNKQPDNCFLPGNKWAAGADAEWPSLVLEVGVSESSPQLYADARWWYSNSGGRTKMVVLVHVHKKKTTIEIWTEVNRETLAVQTRSPADKELACTQSATLEKGRVSNTLEIDFLTLMRRPPQTSREKNLVLTVRWIQEICGP